MRVLRRTIHKQFGGVANFFAVLILVAITVIFFNTFIITKHDRKQIDFAFIFLPAQRLISILESEHTPTDNQSPSITVKNPHNTEKLAKPNPEELQRIQRPATPDAGKI